MNWTNIMSSKGQVYAKKALDFISKTEGPVYFEMVGTCSLLCPLRCYFIKCNRCTYYLCASTRIFKLTGYPQCGKKRSSLVLKIPNPVLVSAF